MKRLISVIVPVYNAELYIEKCINSILNQSYKNIEIVAIDDGSTDKSGYILDQYANRYFGKIKVMHILNGGVTNARLIGISEANGDWIGFVDSDDEIDSDMYVRLINNAEIYKADISHCGYKTVVDNIPKHFFYDTGKLIIQNHEQGISDLLEGDFIEPGLWNKLFAKDLFVDILSNNLIDRKLKNNEDLLMNYLLFSKAKKAVYEDFCPYSYMVRPDSVTRNGFNRNKIYDPIKVNHYILKNVQNNLKEVALRRYLNTCISSYTSLCSANVSKDERNKVKILLRRRRKYWRLLNRNMRIKLYVSYYFPNIYKFAYSVYENNFQKKVYI